ncbi:MAG: hypothetical protein KAS32_12545 [Candidatus Peribacteraceae bacterium]|nr:hypothetical protein [Candidatus Peribacteraceae bacterium]
MKITKEQIQQKTQAKIRAIQTLCKQLQVVATSEQMINEQGFIKQVVYYTDIENYDLAENETKTPEVTPETPTNDKEPPADVETPSL